MNIIMQITHAWSYLEWMLTFIGIIFTLVTTAYFFWIDPFWRAEKLGHLQTVITCVYDKEIQKVLVCHLKKGADKWVVPQGLNEDTLLETARQVLSQELGMVQFFKFRGTQFLGNMLFRKEEKHRLERFPGYKRFKLTWKWRGKTYTCLFVQTEIEFAQIELYREIDEQKYAWMFLYDDIQFVDLATAKILLAQNQEPKKFDLYKKMLKRLEEEFKGGK